jgi:hypothetical protein
MKYNEVKVSELKEKLLQPIMQHTCKSLVSTADYGPRTQTLNSVLDWLAYEEISAIQVMERTEDSRIAAIMDKIRDKGYKLFWNDDEDKFFILIDPKNADIIYRTKSLAQLTIKHSNYCTTEEMKFLRQLYREIFDCVKAGDPIDLAYLECLTCDPYAVNDKVLLNEASCISEQLKRVIIQLDELKQALTTRIEEQYKSRSAWKANDAETEAN